MPEPLLSLATLIDRRTIEIDARRYEIRSPDELSVLDSHRFSQWASRLEALQKAGDESPEMDELADTIARNAVVDVPAEVFAKLTGAQKIAVAEVFFALLLRSRMGVAGATARAMGMEPANRPTGAPFFPGFSGFMAEPRASGWKRRLARLFGHT
jgi:hypothetical protein